MTKLDVKNIAFAQLTLIMLLNYFAECKSRSLVVYNNEFILHALLRKSFLYYTFGKWLFCLLEYFVQCFDYSNCVWPEKK